MARASASLLPPLAPRHSSGDLKCRACGQGNDPASLFCTRCTAPLAVVALAELTGADHRECLASLFQVMADALAQPAAGTPANHDETLWRAYLSAFWLRPETALILYAEALAIWSAVGDSSPGPWLDLGCGDGIHAGLYSGWRFESGFDAFQSLDLEAADIYHHWNPADFSAKIATAGQPIEHGIDIKSTAIARAKGLDVFSSVQQADATRLPLPDGSIRTIFSNMLRDLDEPLPAALDECRRVLSDGGKLLISTMTPTYAHNLYFAPAAKEKRSPPVTINVREISSGSIAAGAFSAFGNFSVEAWRSLLADHGLKLIGVTPIVGPKIIRFWDIGLRPFSIALLKLRQAWIDAGVLGHIKPGIVDFLARSLEPFVSELTAGEPCMNLLVVCRE